jgi:hypothetical protein
MKFRHNWFKINDQSHLISLCSLNKAMPFLSKIKSNPFNRLDAGCTPLSYSSTASQVSTVFFVFIFLTEGSHSTTCVKFNQKQSSHLHHAKGVFGSA